jgi:hypothetical protein
MRMTRCGALNTSRGYSTKINIGNGCASKLTNRRALASARWNEKPAGNRVAEGRAWSAPLAGSSAATRGRTGAEMTGPLDGTLGSLVGRLDLLRLECQQCGSCA